MPSTDGFSSAQRREIDIAVRDAETASRCEFSVYVGSVDGAPREAAERLHAAMAAPAKSVLVMVDPNRRVLQIVTGVDVRRNLSDDSATLAAVAMQAAFAEGDLVGGIKRGLSLLAESARAPKTLHD
ncbi:MAG TPA: DUF5130 family protein [Marmoricola sp.]